jgi:hypothetical protein
MSRRKDRAWPTHKAAAHRRHDWKIRQRKRDAR